MARSETNGLDLDAKALVRQYVRRAEAINASIAEANEDKSAIFKEARGDGLDVRILKRVIQRRKDGSQHTDEVDSLVAVYEHALEGADTPAPSRVRAAEPAPAREDSGFLEQAD